MTTRTLTIATFLLQRIAEDEELAHEATSPDFSGGQYGLALGARVLAECAAKRAIVGSYQWLADNAGRPFAHERAGEMALAERHVKALAQPYASHPDFDPAWRMM